MSLSNKVQQLQQDADVIHQVVHGDANTFVQTEGGPVRSVAKLIADNQAALSAQATLRTDLAKTTGAGLVKVSDGSTVQQKLDALQGQISGAGGVKYVSGIGPDAVGNVVIDTDDVPEAGAKYFTEDRARGTILTGLNTAVSAAVVAADTILAAIGKLQRQISDLVASKVGITSGKINFANVAGTITSFFTNANTGARTYTFPDKDGTVAMTSDVAAAGSLVLLGSVTVSSPVTYINFLNVFTPAYDIYEIVFSDVLNASGTGNQVLSLNFSTNGTSVDGNSVYSGMSGNGGSNANGSDTRFQLFNVPIQGALGKGIGVLKVINANSAGPKGVSLAGSTVAVASLTFGTYYGAAAVKGFRLSITNGGVDFYSGTFRVYGYKNS